MTADPAALGFDAARLRHVDAFLDRYVAAGRLKGWQLAITRRGEMVHATSSGQADAEASRPVADDTIWRLFSMTKPITAVTALAAWERGDFQLTDPVSAYIPSFADLRVWRGGSLTRPATEGITEPMRVWHLFTHMSGLTYGFLNAHPVDALYRAGGFEWGTPPDLDLAGVCDRLATFPLLFQPGTEWNYGVQQRRARPRRRGRRRSAVRRRRAGHGARPARDDRDDAGSFPRPTTIDSPRCTCRCPGRAQRQARRSATTSWVPSRRHRQGRDGRPGPVRHDRRLPPFHGDARRTW